MFVLDVWILSCQVLFHHLWHSYFVMFLGKTVDIFAVWPVCIVMSFHDFLNQPPSATPLTPAVPEAPALIKLLMPAYSSEQSELILFFISVTVNGITCHIDGLQTVNQTTQH